MELDLMTVADFAQRIGLSKQRLYKLWHAGKGPSRIDTGCVAVGRPRYLVPLTEGLRWHEERQARMSAAQRAVGKSSREWRGAKSSAKQHGREVAEQPGEPECPAGPSQSCQPSVSEGCNEGGEPLRGRELSLVWEQHGDVIRESLERHANDVNGDVELLNSIHLDAPAPSAMITVEPIEFDEAKPIEPARPRMPIEPYLTLQDAPGFFGRLFGGQRRYEEEQARRRAMYQADLAKWKEECGRLQAEYDNASAQWTVAVEDWGKRGQEHAVSQEEARRLHGEQIGRDIDYMGEFLGEVINSLLWRECPVFCVTGLWSMLPERSILIAVVDGLKGFPEAITAAFPEATVQTCIVHLVRHSLNFCAWKDRKVVSSDLRRIYGAATAEQAAVELDAFEEKWAGKYASIAPAWRRAWQEVIPFFAFDPAIRKTIYTTNALESLNRVIRKSIKTRGSFPTEEAATKLIYLAIRNFEKGGRNVREWFAARNQFAIMFEDRFNA